MRPREQREHSFKDTSHHRAWHHKRGWPPVCIPMGFFPQLHTPAAHIPPAGCTQPQEPRGGWEDLQEGFRGEEGHFLLPPSQGTTKPWAQPLLQGTGFPHHQVPQLTPSPTPWPWRGRGGCQELGLGCGRSCPAGRARDGHESRAAFPARVGPSWPPSTSLCPLFTWGSTQQPQNADPKGSFPQAVYTPVPYDNRHAEGWTGMGRSCVCHERRLPAGRRGPAPRMAPRQRSQRPCATHRCPGGTPSCPYSPAGTRLRVGTGRDEPESQQSGGWSPSKPYGKGYMVTQ